MKLPWPLMLAGVAMAQSIPSDEIHSHTTPYVPPNVTILTEVRIVEVPAMIRDPHLRTVAGLTRDDFEIDDNGKKQPITSFSVQILTPRTDAGAASINPPPRPRFLAFCFDDLHLLPAQLQLVKDAAERFVRTSLAPNDRAVVLRTSRSEAAKFTADVPSLVDQIAKITSTPRAVADDSERCLHIPPHEAYKIAEHVDPGDQLLHAKIAECSACYRNTCPEAMVTGAARNIWGHARSSTANELGMLASLIEGMAKLPGERMILLTSGGFLTGTFEADVDRLMNEARHAEVLINGLDARGLYQNMSAGTAYDGMGVLASGTGGIFFHSNNDMEQGFRVLGMVPETTYLLGFTPPGAPDGKFHKLNVRLAANKGYSIEARLGYNALPASTTPTIDSEVTASDTIPDLPVSFTWEQWQGPSAITMIANLDIAHLHFKPNQDRRAQRLTIVAVAFDKSGAFVAGKRSDLQLNFKDATFAQFAKTGFKAALTIQAPPGSYSVRAVAQDAMESKLAAASAEVTIK